MAGRTHVFLAMSRFAFGEALLGLRLARQLHDRGDRVLFLAPSTLGVMLAGAPVRFGNIDLVWSRIDEALRDVLQAQTCASVVLLDAASVFLALYLLGLHDRFLERIAEPVVALDVWNLPETNLRWDTGTDVWPIPAVAARLRRRLVPVPFVRVAAGPGRFNAMPAAADAGGRARAELRRELGLGDGDRLILLTTAKWQTLFAQVDAYQIHIARIVPMLLVAHLQRLDARVRILHVGPDPLIDGAALPAYRFVPQMAPARFREVVTACDLVMTLNVAATTITTALRHDVPVVVVVNSCSAAHPDELAAALPRPLPPGLAERIGELTPLHPFRVWPLGLHEFLTPVLAGNPYLDCLDVVEILDGDAVLEACRRLLFDRAARDDAAARRAAYVAAVDQLPAAADAFEAVLGP